MTAAGTATGGPPQQQRPGLRGVGSKPVRERGVVAGTLLTVAALPSASWVVEEAEEEAEEVPAGSPAGNNDIWKA